MSPTSPSKQTLIKQLNEAHRRIRELEAREAELLAQIETGTLTRLVEAPDVSAPGNGQSRKSFSRVAQSFWRSRHGRNRLHDPVRSRYSRDAGRRSDSPSSPHLCKA